MIIGAHVILYSKDADADRAFIRDVLGFSHVDAGQGWLIFALPPAEVAVHPSDENDLHEFFLMTDDLAAETARLEALGVACEPPNQLRWGVLTRIALPGGGKLGLYQPLHPMAIEL
jgi:catechol 2,3-dioxygenase-like lactoylglutathione lyase family enzyme